MSLDLTSDQQKQVDKSRRSSRPSVYNPSGTAATIISRDFEAWLILASKDTKARVVEWVKELLKQEADDDYQNLLKETLDSEEASLMVQETDLSSASEAFTEWRSNSSVSGFETVQELNWLFQELQQGFSPQSEISEINHHERLRAVTGDRLALSADSEESRAKRLNTWVAVLTSY